LSLFNVTLVYSKAIIEVISKSESLNNRSTNYSY